MNECCYSLIFHLVLLYLMDDGLADRHAFLDTFLFFTMAHLYGLGLSVMRFVAIAVVSLFSWASLYLFI